MKVTEITAPTTKTAIQAHFDALENKNLHKDSDKCASAVADGSRCHHPFAEKSIFCPIHQKKPHKSAIASFVLMRHPCELKQREVNVLSDLTHYLINNSELMEELIESSAACSNLKKCGIHVEDVLTRVYDILNEGKKEKEHKKKEHKLDENDIYSSFNVLRMLKNNKEKEKKKKNKKYDYDYDVSSDSDDSSSDDQCTGVTAKGHRCPFSTKCTRNHHTYL